MDDTAPRKRGRRRSVSERENLPPVRYTGPERWILGSFLCTLFGSVLALGSVHVGSLITIGCVASLGMLLLTQQRELMVPSCAAVALTLSAYCLVQTIPVPVEWLGEAAQETWSRALLPWNTAPVRWGALSMDPTASRIEALRWAILACVFCLAAWIGKRSGESFVLASVFSCAVAVAALTLLHGLLGVSKVYGWYDPTFTPYRWAVSPLLNPNNLSGYLNLSVFIGMGLLASARTQERRWLAGLGVALLVAQSVLTSSRGGVLSLIVGLAAWGVMMMAERRSASLRVRSPGGSAVGVLGALALGLVLAFLGARPETWQDLRQEGLEKLAVARWAVPLIADYPLFGSGAGSFETVFPAYKTIGTPVVWAHPENFVVAWLTDWGIVVAPVAIGAFAWCLRPSRLGVPRSLRNTSAFLGVAVLLLQNLADLAFAVPGVMIALASVLGGLTGAEERRAVRLGERQASLASPKPWAIGACTVAILCLGITLIAGRRPVASERRALHEQLAATHFEQDSSVRQFLAELSNATQRHPGEQFFPLLGALAASARQEDPMPWIARALERDVTNGRTHLLLAHVLHGRGAHKQALMELRLALEREHGLVWQVGSDALRWTRTPSDLWLTVPRTESASTLLTAYALNLGRPNEAQARADFLKTALERTPNFAPAHALAAIDIMQSMLEKRPPCDVELERCRRKAASHIAKVAHATFAGGSHTELTGQLLATSGDPAKAVQYLGENCVNSDQGCVRRMVIISAAATLPLEEVAQSYLAIACVTPQACADTNTWIGQLYEARGDRANALRAYSNAVEQVGSQNAWLEVARVAAEIGNFSLARESLARAKRFGTLTEPRFIDLERRLLVDSVRSSP